MLEKERLNFVIPSDTFEELHTYQVAMMQFNILLPRQDHHSSSSLVSFRELFCYCLYFFTFFFFFLVKMLRSILVLLVPLWFAVLSLFLGYRLKSETVPV